MALAAQLMRGLGSDNVDFRLRQTDFRGDGQRRGHPVARACRSPTLGTLDRVLVVGSFLRKDHPLLAQRLRQAAKKGAQVSMLHSVDDDWLMPRRAHGRSSPPSLLPRALARDRRRGRARRRASRCRPRWPASSRSAAAQAIAASLAVRRAQARSCSATTPSSIRDASQLHALAQALAEITGATLGFLARGREQRRRLPRRRAAASGRPERAGDARRRRARPTCCCTPSPSSTAPTRSPRAPRSSRPSSSSC